MEIEREAKPSPGPTLLAVLAHPDDETFGMGGTLALYAKRGVAVYLVCATRGEVGDVPDGMLQGYASVGELREDELRCAARKLGLSGVFFLGYRDSGMPGSPDNSHSQALAAAPQEKVTGEVIRYIRELQPQVVLTFDPIGGYYHPDHIAIQRATAAAFTLAGDPTAYPDGQSPYQPQRLYFNTFSRQLLRIAVRLMPLFGQDPRHIGRNKDVDFASIATVDYPIHARIDYRPVLAARQAAAMCHASQGGGGMTRGVQGIIQRLIRGRETYMQAYPEPADGRVLTDLFEGVDKTR